MFTMGNVGTEDMRRGDAFCLSMMHIAVSGWSLCSMALVLEGKLPGWLQGKGGRREGRRKGLAVAPGGRRRGLRDVTRHVTCGLSGLLDRIGCELLG